MEVFFEALIDKKGYIDVLEGLKNTLIIAVLGLIIGIVIGTFIAITRVVPKDKLIWKILNKVSSVYVAFFRGTPIMVQLLIMFYMIPYVLNIDINNVLAGILVFGMNSGAYISEIMRGGILSVDHGQLEAGRSLGLSYRETMFKIILPQAVKNIIPTLGNEFITLVKETSIVGYIAIIDLTKAFDSMAGNSYEYIFSYLTLAAIYLILVLGITLLIRLIERRLRKGDKR